MYKGEVVAVKVVQIKGEEDRKLLLREIVTLHDSQHDNANFVHYFNVFAENILLTSDDPPKVKLADFGLARKLDPIGMMTPFRGTFKYMAPEIYDTVSEEVIADHKVDVFSFSMILWNLLSSSEPFQKDSAADAHIKMETEGERPSLDEIPMDFKPLLRSCWSKDPDERPNFTEIIDTLSTAAVPDAGL